MFYLGLFTITIRKRKLNPNIAKGGSHLYSKRKMKGELE